MKTPASAVTSASSENDQGHAGGKHGSAASASDAEKVARVADDSGAHVFEGDMAQSHFAVDGTEDDQPLVDMQVHTTVKYSSYMLLVGWLVLLVTWVVALARNYSVAETDQAVAFGFQVVYICVVLPLLVVWSSCSATYIASVPRHGNEDVCVIRRPLIYLRVLAYVCLGLTFAFLQCTACSVAVICIVAVDFILIYSITLRVRQRQRARAAEQLAKEAFP
jgi:hypothetical protein